MMTNFTPIDVQKFRGENNSVNTALLLIVTLTALVLVVLLFILIQKKTGTPSEMRGKTVVTPTIQMVSPSPTQIPTPEASPSGKVDITPTKSATGSAPVSY